MRMHTGYDTHVRCFNGRIRIQGIRQQQDTQTQQTFHCAANESKTDSLCVRVVGEVPLPRGRIVQQLPKGTLSLKQTDRLLLLFVDDNAQTNQSKHGVAKCTPWTRDQVSASSTTQLAT